VHHTAKYAAFSSLLFVVACGASAFGLSVAGKLFAPQASSERPVAQTAEMARATQSRPQSALLGSDPERVSAARQDWVEVVDSVNMRQGPSSANAVIKVQLAGTKLRVASRDGKWVEVVEPKTGGTGWVFDDYVKPVAPASRRAEAAETAIR